MKYFWLLLLSLFSCTHQTNPLLGQKNPFIILVAGQSNGVSMAVSPGDFAYSLTGMVSVTDINSGASGKVFTETSPSWTSISWIILGDLIASKTGHPVRIINVSIGSTSSRDWVQKYSYYIKDSIEDYHPDVLLFVQGEEDAFLGFGQDETYSNYREIVSFSMGTPFYLALDSYGSVETRSAQEKIIQEGYVRPGADIDRLRMGAETDASRLHFTGMGFKSHAEAWLEILKGIL